MLESEPLVNLQKEVERFCETALSVLPESGKRPYHQHVTLAFRDLSKNEFRKAWDALKDESFSNSFVADRIILLRHNDREWVTKYEFLFGETNTNYPYDPATEASL